MRLLSFYINLPFGLITAIFIFFFFKSPKVVKASAVGWRAKLREFDLYGTILFLPAIVSLLLALQWGGSKYAWGNGRIIGLFIVFGVLILGFIAIQIWKGEHATVPPRVFKNRTVWSSAWFGAALGAAFFILVYYLRKRASLPAFDFHLLTSPLHQPSGSRPSRGPRP